LSFNYKFIRRPVNTRKDGMQRRNFKDKKCFHWELWMKKNCSWVEDNCVFTKKTLIILIINFKTAYLQLLIYSTILELALRGHLACHILVYSICLCLGNVVCILCKSTPYSKNSNATNYILRHSKWNFNCAACSCWYKLCYR
jgi:hypothetical protein